jgi:NADPH:quinone reductase
MSRQMKAMLVPQWGGPEVFQPSEIPVPEPGPRDLLVKVYATAVNPCDYQTRRGDYQDWVKLPALLGGDVSGVVERVGSEVQDFRPGDEVFYMPPVFQRPGAYAEYNVVDERIVARKPKNLSHFEAAALPLVGATAWDCLVDRGKVQVGESVLIHAGAGGIGSFSVQLAKVMGAYVFSTVSAKNADLVKGLGADRVIDYRSEDYIEVIQKETGGEGVDLVLDTIGGDTVEKSPEALRMGGRLVSIVDIPQPQNLLAAWSKNITMHFLFTVMYREKLDKIRDLVERGLIRPVIDSVVPLSEVAQAHCKIEEGGVRGKIILDPSR